MTVFLITLVIALVLSAIGFKEYVWFISTGYGLSVAGIGLYLAIMGAWLPGIVLLVYGLRLSGYITYRSLRTTYNKKMKGEVKDGKSVSIGAKIAIWISVSIMYAFMAVPVSVRVIEDDCEPSVVMIIGLVIAVFGLVFESTADTQKQIAKKQNPKRFVDTGLYKIVRCPNYLGELIFWTGILISGVTVLSNALEWIIAILGYLLIVFVMFSGARRLEVRQNKSYKEDEEYQKYHDTTPILIPFIPLYSVEKYKWLVA